MELTTYKGEPVADPGRFIRLTLRGHCVRWRLERRLAEAAQTAARSAPPVDRRPPARTG